MASSNPINSIFLTDWWLDVSARGSKWGYATVRENNSIVASMPWVLRQNAFGFNIIDQPPLTYFHGPTFNLSSRGLSSSKQVSVEHNLMSNLISQLPRFDYFSQRFSHTVTNWLPFYWQGYSQQTSYTYILQDLSSIDDLWSNLHSNIRREIRKAIKQNVTVEQTDDIDSLLLLVEKSFHRQNRKLPYRKSFAKSLFEACKNHNSAAIFLARGSNGELHAGNLIVWDELSSYYLIGGGDPDLRTSGATSLAMWHAIKFCSRFSNSFDFEGSMNPRIEQFVRAFGASQVSSHVISKHSSKLLLSSYHFKSILKSLI